MTSAAQRKTQQGHQLNALFLAMVMLTCAFNGANARAESLAPSEFRILAAGQKFSGVRQYAVTFKLRPPRRLRSKYLELAVGSISSTTESRAFVSFGPVWRLPFARKAAFVDLGFSPTLISGSRFDGRDLGGHLHFTSSVSIGVKFGGRQPIALALRAQHTSNGGLSDTNPGIDMVGLNFTFSFAGS